MASFSDKTPTFNPYVQQQPVEAMVNVGMYKQQQYDQGLEAIQQSYNDIAGLDIIKGTDRSYLENKMSETTNKLKGLAAGDFSNQQLTKSVTGMISGLAKDENVKNAVYSTQKVRAELGKASAAQKAGETSVVNLWALNKQVNSWMNDGEVGSSFSGEYVPYTDVDAKLREVYEKIDETDTHIENPFVRDVNGNTMYFSPDGKQSSTTPQAGWETKVDHAMLTKQVKGKSAQKILDNFMTSLSADDIRQLGLNASYHYKDVDADALKAEFSQRMANKKDQYNKAVTDIDLELSTNKSLTPAQKEKLTAARNNYSNAINDGKLDRELEIGLQELNNPASLEQYKSRIYIDNYLNNMSKDLATQSIKQTYETNPYFQAQMDLKNLKFKYDNASRDQKNKDRLYSLSVAELAWKKEYAVRKDLREIEDTGVHVTTTAKETEGASDYGIDNIRDEIAVLRNEGITEINNTYASRLIKKGTDPEQARAYLDGLAEEYIANPGTIVTDSDQFDFLEERRKLHLKLKRKEQLVLSATSENDHVNALDAQLEQKTKDLGVVVSPDGVQYEAKEALEFLNGISDLYTIPKTIMLDSKTPQTLMILDTDAMVRRYKGTRKESYANTFAKYHKGEELTNREQAFIDSQANLTKDAIDIAGNINQEKVAYQNEFIRERSPEAMVQTGVINPENKRDINAAKSLVNLKINQINKGVGELDNYKKGDWNSELAAEWIKDKGTATGYIIKKDYSGNTVFEIQNGGKTISAPLSNEELIRYFPDAAISNPLNAAVAATMSNSAKTTNLQGVVSPEGAVTAMFSGYDIPGVAKLIDSDGNPIAQKVRMDIQGSPRNNGSETDTYKLILYYNLENGSWSMKETPRSTTLSGIQGQINSIDITDINAIKNQ